MHIIQYLFLPLGATFDQARNLAKSKKYVCMQGDPSCRRFCLAVLLPSYVLDQHTIIGQDICAAFVHSMTYCT